MITSLESVLQHALHNKTAVAGFVGLGWEDMRAYVKAAELENKPVIIQAGPGCRAHTPIEVLGPMMCHLADSVNVPVVVHLDHSKSIDECSRAIAMGFSSVMFDGSDLPIEENIRLTQREPSNSDRHQTWPHSKYGGRCPLLGPPCTPHRGCRLCRLIRAHASRRWKPFGRED